MNAFIDPTRDPRALPPAPGALEVAQGRVPMVPEPQTLYGMPVEAETHFWDYWQVVSRRRWTIICVFLGTLLAATLYTFTVRPVFTGTVSLRIEKEPPRVVKFEEVVKEADSQQDYYQTQYKILQSRSLANRVIGLLQLDQHPEFQDDQDGWMARGETWVREQLVRWIPVPPPAAPENTEDLAVASPLTDTFLRRVSVDPVRNARLVNVSFDSRFPDLAARVANTMADAFIAQQMDRMVETTRYATQFLAKQLEEARDKLGESETHLSNYLNASGILFVTADRMGQPQDIITQQLTIMSEAVLKARADRMAKESLLTQASVQDPFTLPAVLQSLPIGQLKQVGADLEGEYRRLSQVFKPDYPKMLQLKEKIEENRRQVRTEVDRMLASLKADYESSVRSEKALEASLAKQSTLARGLAENMAEYNLLRREVDTNRDLYGSLLSRLRETQISAALLTSNISVVDAAEIPASPSRPRKGLNLAIACLAGLAGGIGLAFLFEYLDTNIKDTKEVESLLRVPALGVVPSRAAFERMLARRKTLEAGSTSPTPFALVAHSELPSVFAEAFRNLRTSILYSTPERPPKTLMMTSLQPEDGKTSLVTNLAITLAQLGGSPVVLVDADMRRPMVHRVLNVESTPGLSTYLTGQADLDQVIVPSGIPNLFVIPAGRIPVNPAELLASARLREGIEALSQRFAYVVFDTGPLFGVSDAMILAGQLEGTVLVLRHGRASRDAAQRAIRSLVAVRARLLGVILNDVDIHANSYGYYDSYYGYSSESSVARRS
jgi:polysaccharide biosynthesis transport protein